LMSYDIPFAATEGIYKKLNNKELLNEVS
jgi:hypothetical protein